MTKKYRPSVEDKARPAKMKAAGPSDHDMKAKREAKRRQAKRWRAKYRKIAYKLR